MNELALFAGAGGGILGGKLLGWRTVCAVECDQYAATVLAQRQNDGFLEAFPIWDDVQTFDGRPWQGIVDVISGGFPCQDISVAGKGSGIDGERSGMWKHMARIIGEVRPRFVFVENSPSLISRGLGRVLGDLSKLGYDARWGIVGANDAGAPHVRKRIWIAAYTEGREARLSPKRQRRENSTGRSANCSGNKITWTKMADANSAQREGMGFSNRIEVAGWSRDSNASCAWWRSDPSQGAEPEMGRMAHRVAYRVDRLKAIGNGQVPSVAALAWRILSETL